MFAPRTDSPLVYSGRTRRNASIARSRCVRFERSRHLHADARRSLRDDGEAEPGDEDALVEEARRQRHRLGRLADDDRDDRRLAVERPEAGVDEHLPEDTRVLAQPREELRPPEHELDRAERAACHRRRKRVREELRARALGEDVADLLRGRDVAARRSAERLAERAGDDVDLAEQPEVLDGPAPRLPENAHAVRVVDDHDRVVLARELDDLGELREVAFHREDAVGDDQLARVAWRGLESVPERTHVGVRIDDLRRRARQPDRVDEARVVQRVGEDHRRLVGEARNAGLVRVPARDVRERGLGSGEIRERTLEREMRFERAADEADGCRSRAVALEPLDPGPHDLGITRETEVVVRGEDDHLAPPLHLDDGPLRRLEREEPLVRAGIAEPVELRAELAVESRAHVVTPFGRRTILQASPDSSSANASS